MAPVESGIEDVAGPTSVEELPLPEIVMVVSKVKVSVPVMVLMPGIFTVKVPVLVVCDVVTAVGLTGEVEFEKEDGVAGEPSVEEELPPVGAGRDMVYVVPIEMVTLRVTDKLLEAPVGPTGKLEPVPYAGRLSVPERGRLETGNGGNEP